MHNTSAREALLGEDDLTHSSSLGSPESGPRLAPHNNLCGVGLLCCVFVGLLFCGVSAQRVLSDAFFCPFCKYVYVLIFLGSFILWDDYGRPVKNSTRMDEL